MRAANGVKSNSPPIPAAVGAKRVSRGCHWRDCWHIIDKATGLILGRVYLSDCSGLYIAQWKDKKNYRTIVGGAFSLFEDAVIEVYDWHVQYYAKTRIAK